MNSNTPFFPVDDNDQDVYAYRLAAQNDPRYKPAAFCFVHYCLKILMRNMEPGKHASCKMLCGAVVETAKRDFGAFALDILNTWGIHETIDLGNIVYALKEMNLVATSKDDSLASFVDLFPFKKAFRPPPISEKPQSWSDLTDV